MVRVLTIIILVFGFIGLITAVTLGFIYGFHPSGGSGGGSIVTDYEYGPTMFFAKSAPPLPITDSSDDRMFPGLKYVDPSSFNNQKGTTLLDLSSIRIDSSSSDVVFSTSSWIGKAFISLRTWNAPNSTVVYNNPNLSNGLFRILCNMSTTDVYKSELYMYTYAVPWNVMLNKLAFPGSVEACKSPGNENNYADHFFYRQIGLETASDALFFAPVLHRNPTVPNTFSLPLKPEELQFSIVVEPGSEFTNTLVYKKIADPQYYFRVTLSKLIPYILVEFTGVLILNASAGNMSINTNSPYHSTPVFKVFKFDNNPYEELTSAFGPRSASQIIMSSGDRMSVSFITSTPVNVYGRRVEDNTIPYSTESYIMMTHPTDSTIPVTVLVSPRSFAAVNVILPPQIPSDNVDDSIVKIDGSLLPTPDEAVKSIRCTGVTMNSTDFTVNYEATTTANNFIFVPYIGMLKGSIEGASPIADTVFSCNTSYSPLYRTTGKTFSVRHSYLAIPEYNYPHLTSIPTSIQNALDFDVSSVGVIPPIVFNADSDKCDDVYGFGKKIFNQAQTAWIAKNAGRPDQYNTAVTTLKNFLTQVLQLRLPSSTPNKNDTTTYPDPGSTSNIRLTYGYYPTLKMLTVMDTVFGSSFNHAYGNDHIIHQGYLIYSIYLYLSLVNDPAEDAKFRDFVIALMRDVAQPYLDDPRFPRMRHFDFAYGLSWLAGIVDELNVESCSEVINGYYGCYLMAKKFGDTKLEKFYAAILTMEIKTNQEIRFFGKGLPANNEFAKLLVRNQDLYQRWVVATPGSPPFLASVGDQPIHFLKLGIATQVTHQRISFNTLFGANSFPDIVFIIFLPFSPITRLWWNKDIGDFVAQKVNLALSTIYDYWFAQNTAIPDMSANNTNILITSSYSATNFTPNMPVGQYVGRNVPNIPAGRVLPAPIIGNYFVYVLQFMSYHATYATEISSFIISSNQLIQSSYPPSACGLVSSVVLNTTFSHPEFYPFMQLDGGASNTVLRASLMSILNLIS